MTRYRRLIPAGAALAVILVLLSGPVAEWLQDREAWIADTAPVDALYILAGPYESRIRIEAAAARYLAMTHNPPVLMTGNDPHTSRWSRRHQRNLTASEWTVEQLRQTLGTAAPEQMAMVKGRFWGTDGEMEALDRYLAARPELERVALITSRSHIRRTHDRARHHLGARYAGMIPARATAHDRYPWTVALELVKLARDSLGLARAPLLSRRWWSGVFQPRSP